MSPRTEVLDTIRRNHAHASIIAVPVDFIDLCGDSDSALFLAQLLYWTDRARLPDHWVYKSRQEWCDELRMNRYRFDAARRRLRALDLLEQAYHLVGARRILHLRLRHDLLCSLLSTRLQRGEGSTRGSTCEGTTVSSFGGGNETSVATPSEGRKTGGRGAVRHPLARVSTCTPKYRAPDARLVDNPPSERLGFDHPRTETPTQTPSKTPSETPSQIPTDTRAARAPEDEGAARAGKGKPMERREEGGGPALSATGSGIEPQTNECHRRSTISGFDCGGLQAVWQGETVYEDRLFEVLQRMKGFPREHDHGRLREILVEYPEMDHVAAFAEFAERWRGELPVRPWAALRWWLKRRADELARRGRHEEPRDSVQVTLPTGAARLVPVRHVWAQPRAQVSGGVSCPRGVAPAP